MCIRPGWAHLIAHDVGLYGAEDIEGAAARQLAHDKLCAPKPDDNKLHALQNLRCFVTMRQALSSDSVSKKRERCHCTVRIGLPCPSSVHSIIRTTSGRAPQTLICNEKSLNNSSNCISTYTHQLNGCYNNFTAECGSRMPQRPQ